MPGSPSYEVAADVRCEVGEGPVWDVAAQCLWWVDIPAGRLHRLDSDGSTRPFALGLMVGAVAVREAGGLILAAQGGFYSWGPSADGVSLLAGVDSGDDGRRMNDGTCDTTGRFWAGAMAVDAAPGAGVLWSLEVDGQVQRRLDGLTIPNGIGWSPDGSRMYVVDSTTHRVDVLELDAAGELGKRRPFAVLPEAVLPDGLTVDADGGVWVALWGGWGVHHYSAAGDLVEVWRLPVAQVTSCAFGGSDLTDLYVTTAAAGLPDADRVEQPLAGAVFRFPGAGAGRPANVFRG